MNESQQAAASAVEKLRFAATRREFDRLPSSELPELAMFALEAGLDTPSLRELAGELHPTWADTGPLFDRVLQDCGIAIRSRSLAGHALARTTPSRLSPVPSRPTRVRVAFGGMLPTSFGTTEMRCSLILSSSVSLASGRTTSQDAPTTSNKSAMKRKSYSTATPRRCGEWAAPSLNSDR